MQVTSKEENMSVRVMAEMTRPSQWVEEGGTPRLYRSREVR